MNIKHIPRNMFRVLSSLSSLVFFHSIKSEWIYVIYLSIFVREQTYKWHSSSEVTLTLLLKLICNRTVIKQQGVTRLQHLGIYCFLHSCGSNQITGGQWSQNTERELAWHPLTSVGVWISNFLVSFSLHHDVIKWKHFPRYWPFVWGIHRSPVNFPQKGQWRGALMFALICVRINGWVNNREAGDSRHHRAHYDVIIMLSQVIVRVIPKRYH